MCYISVQKKIVSKACKSNIAPSEILNETLVVSCKNSLHQRNSLATSNLTPTQSLKDLLISHHPNTTCPNVSHQTTKTHTYKTYHTADGPKVTTMQSFK